MISNTQGQGEKWGAVTAALALTLVLAGCTASSLPFSNRLDANIRVPKGYVTNGTEMGGPDADWTKSFNDKTLNKLIEESLKYNYDLAAARARIDQARANQFGKRGDRLLPQLDANANAGRQQQAFIGFPFGGPEGGGGGGGSSSSLSNQFGVSLDIAWEVDLWGRKLQGENAAIARTEAAEFDRSALLVSLSAQTAKAWFTLIEANQQFLLAEQSVKSFRDSAETIRDQFLLADQSGAQLRLSMADVAEAQADFEQRKDDLKVAARELEILLGRYPGGEVKAAKDLPKMPKAPPAGMPAQLLHRRADLAAAERRVAANFSDVKEAKRALLPTVSLTGSAGSLSEEAAQLLMFPETAVWNIAASTTHSLINRGQTVAETRRRKGVREESIADYQKSALTAFKEVENALNAEKTLRDRAAALEKADALLLEAYQRSREEFRDGVGDVLTILAAQRQLLSTRSQLLTVRRLRLDNRVNLHLALGGGFDAKPYFDSKEDKKKMIKKEEPQDS